LSSNNRILAVVRIRGDVGVRREIRDTLKMLRLHRVHHAVLVPDVPSYRGMLQKAKDYITWGEIDSETLSILLERRGRLEGGKRLTNEFLKENTRFNSVRELADKILKGEAKISDVPKLKPVFRLHPPKGGYKRGTKRPYNDGGELGYRGAAINELIRRMA